MEPDCNNGLKQYNTFDKPTVCTNDVETVNTLDSPRPSWRTWRKNQIIPAVLLCMAGFTQVRDKKHTPVH